jgi:predicted heme/steroid binding protein
MVPLDKKVFTREELRQYDGHHGLVYVAYNGKVYDVSNGRRVSIKSSTTPGLI